MRRFWTVVFALLPLASAIAGEPESGGVSPAASSGSHVLGRVIAYLPDRALDLLDVVRLRVRAGPGQALSLRATEGGSVFLGSYASIYAGLPGPRGRKFPRLPAGIESRSGVEISAADLSSGLGSGPDYSATEIGAGLQLVLLGIDVGVDPLELIDFAAGIFLFDPRGDDY